jgi:hypothetical protein
MVQETLDSSGDHEWHRKTWIIQEPWYKKPWMVRETINGTGNLDGSGDHERYRKPRWFRRP